ncbi:MAG: RelE toxin of RelE / RelB toxin-antitoxin system [uncultured Campylobacterales bacterium]|uniref:RelE toxin of RelE / RelB toxin-antitoxin system n=1 Tax=uncultured Campylobacterales bacterium TaxID=352960 RepID=A0A6S6SIF0_9BACT|nr:MAG: RelE toxin of RelE / RelB toxin-antitoxin system [uncultured Campylobacterales bacterium]
MSYEVLVVDEFKRNVKKLFKKYKFIKQDLLPLVSSLEKDAFIGTHLGSNIYKTRVKNSDLGGKSGGYRVVYYTHLPKNRIYLLTVFSKTQKANINVKELQPILKKIKD